MRHLGVRFPLALMVFMNKGGLSWQSRLTGVRLRLILLLTRALPVKIPIALSIMRIESIVWQDYSFKKQQLVALVRITAASNMNNTENFLKELKFYDCDLTKIRIGNKGDGGYIALKEICINTPMVYSFGVGNDVGFEFDFVKNFLPQEVKLFDPTINALPGELPIFTFSKYRFDLKTLKSSKIQTELHIVKKEYSEPKNIPDDSLLKIDIEGDEWDALLEFDKKTLKKFSQILIEFHIVHVQPREGLSPYFQKFYQENLNKINEDLFGTYYEIIKKLNEQFYAFHVHANNSLSLIKVGGYSLPPLLEVSFIRKDLVDDVQETITNFPVEGLDFPNKTDRQDILNWYPIC